MSTEDKARWAIFFNGPPGVGKDTAAQAVAAYISYHAAWMHPLHMKIAEPIKDGAHRLFGLKSWTTDRFDDPKLAPEKDIPCDEFFGQTPRQAYIDIATYARERFGTEFFGWIARRTMARSRFSQVFIFSDCGFADELGPIVDYVGPKNVLVVEIGAVGKSFANDSRGYIGTELKERFPDITVRSIKNEFGDVQDRELFKVYCKGAAKGFLKLEERAE